MSADDTLPFQCDAWVRRVHKCTSQCDGCFRRQHEATVARSESVQTFAPTHGHADGGVYRFVGNAKYKTAAEDAVWSDAIIYEAKDGRFYVTTPARWHDRFTPLPEAPK